MRSRVLFRRISACALAFLLALSSPLQAFAETTTSKSVSSSVVEQWSSANEDSNKLGYSPYSYSSEEAGLALLSDSASDAQSNSELPATYDLRDFGYVTPVKNQTPWGTCWGFAAIAACETSILSEMGKTYVETGLDLSELQLAYFAFRPVPSGSQAGEGLNLSAEMASKNPNYMLNVGAFQVYATTLFSSGTGPVSESMAPYKNQENVIDCDVTYEDYGGWTKVMSLSEAAIKALELKGASIKKNSYSADIYTYDEFGNAIGTSEPATWSVDEKLWGTSSYELEESNILPEYLSYNYETGLYDTSQAAIEATKREIKAGRGVAVSFKSEQFLPGQAATGVYLDFDTWGHYTYEHKDVTHTVTIVGWDDTFSKENFGSGDASKQPEADGAWIVKNSWGASTEEFPNTGDWGIKDENGNATGYFYLSYYDKSICRPESFNFDLSSYSSSDTYELYQYDYLVSPSVLTLYCYGDATHEANVFTADENSLVRTLSCQTTAPNTEVTYQVYVLDDGASNPDEGTLVYETSATYEFGGYHRAEINKSDWIYVKAGQKFSVVVTQYSKDDDLYLQSATKNNSKVKSEEEIEKKRKDLTEELKKSAFNNYFEVYKEQFLNEGMSEEEATKKAQEEARIVVNGEQCQKEIAEIVEEQITVFTAETYKAVVNEGESYTYTYTYDPETGEATGSWSDWASVVKQMEESSGDEIFDNFPVKAYAELAYSATFDACGGTLSGADAQYVVAGDKLQKPANPTREGYTFAGWFSQSEGGTEFDFATQELSEDIVLYAHWIKNQDPEPVTPSPASPGTPKTQPSEQTSSKTDTLPQTGESGYLHAFIVCLAGATVCLSMSGVLGYGRARKRQKMR